MRKRYSIALPLIAASLLVGPHPKRPFAAETATISSPVSQAVDADSIRPPANGQAASYQLEQNTAESEPQGLKDYLDANEQISVFGIDMRVETRTAEKEIQGLLVVDVAPGSPGAAAGLHPYRQPARDLLNGAGMLAVMAFPPAIIVVVPIVKSVPLHESYDLIIGVDGFRVSNFPELYDRIRDVRPGEVVYLNVLRDGRRLQVPMQITSALAPPQSWVR